MRTKLLIAGGFLLVALLVLASQTFFRVDQTQFVVITRFGEIQRSVTAPGLGTKLPFIDTVNRLDNRLLHIDVPTATMPDREKQNLEIDAYVRYRINDPKKFIETLITEDTAANRLGRIVISEIREEVARSTRSDIIGGAVTESVDEATGEPIRIVTPLTTRADMMQRVRERSDFAVKSVNNDFGVTIVDVRIKAADFPEATLQSIFNRMRSERDVQAKRLRAEGEQLSLGIRADVDRQRTIILAEAERDANELRGVGEAEAIRILAGALEQDPEFFAFRRSLQAYSNFLQKNTTVVLPADSDLFSYLQGPNSSTGSE